MARKQHKVTGDRYSLPHMVRLTANECGYHLYEVEDVLLAFYEVMRNELYSGKAILFEKLFRAQIVKPKPRLLYDFKSGEKKLSPAHPKLKVTPTIGLLDYIREMPESTLVVKRGTASKRQQHHSGTTQEEYYAVKRKRKPKGQTEEKGVNP